MLKRFTAELIGALVLVFFGCGAAVLGGFDIVGQLGIALAFGLAIVAMAYDIGPVSGCHVNPAVFVAGRMSARDLLLYWLAQFVGALLGAALLAAIAKTGFANLGQNGFGDARNRANSGRKSAEPTAREVAPCPCPPSASSSPGAPTA